jgi:DNA-binding MarR family transcriptional regulator
MKVQKALLRLAAAADDPAELRRVARALANELPHQQPDVLRSVRAGLAGAELPEKSFAAGYVAGMLDVAAEYEGHVHAEADRATQHDLAARQDAHAVLSALAVNPARPSELAGSLGRETAAVAHLLDELEVAGLVQAHAIEADDRHMRPYQLTLTGTRVLDGLPPALSSDIETGIRIAIRMFGYLSRHDSSPASALQEIAEEALHDPDAAAAAVQTWAVEAKDAELVTESEIPPPPHGIHLPDKDEVFYSSPRRQAQADVRSERLWQHVPVFLAQLDARREAGVPVYVRTNASGWSAWAFALQSQDETGMSRTILDGDILTRSVSPPDQRFDLIYDNREALEADRDEPTMRAFLERADEKFMVATHDDDVPEGFTRLAPGQDDTDSDPN